LGSSGGAFTHFVLFHRGIRRVIPRPTEDGHGER
jgi:hypothetical protein